MKKGKMTPGPWKVSDDGCDIEAVYGPEGGDTFGICTMYADESSEANAQAIASLPDLVKALQVISFTIGNIDHSTGHGENSARMRGEILNDIRKISKAALAKAGIGGEG
jgi:hypothetical protein